MRCVIRMNADPWGTCQGPGDIIPPPSDFELQLAELAGLSLSRSCQARTRFRTSRVLCRGQGGGGEAPGTAPRVHFQQASTLASDWCQGQDHLGLCSHWSRRARAAHNDVTAQWSRDLASAMLDWITPELCRRMKFSLRFFEKSGEN